MRVLTLLAAAGLLVAAGIALLSRASSVDRHDATPTFAAAAAGVHATTEADLALLRAARPRLDGPVLGGLRMRWCVAQGRCRDASGVAR